jgi:cytochrome c biogenesis factor
MKGLSRSTALKIASVLSILMGLVSIANTLPLIARGATEIAQSSDSPPYFVLMIGLFTGIIAIIGAYGAWNQQRWGIILSILVNLVNGLSAVPGILFAPQPGLMILSIATVVVSILIVVLCLWRERKPMVV